MRYMDLKRLVLALAGTSLTDFEFKHASGMVRISRRSQSTSVPNHRPVGHVPFASEPGPFGALLVAEEGIPDGHIVRSPVVGIAEMALGIEVGVPVTQSTMLCRVVALNTYEEVRAPLAGTIREICATQGAAVEFDQPLLVID